MLRPVLLITLFMLSLSCSTPIESGSDLYADPTTEECQQNATHWRQRVETLRQQLAANPNPNTDGSMTAEERELNEVQNKLDYCRYNHSDYGDQQHLGYDAESTKPRSFAETCRIINGNRVCDIPYKTKEFECRHYAGATKQVLTQNGVPCTINTYSTSHILGGHANNIVQVKSQDPNKDRYCMLEPQTNKLTDCWYTSKGQGPGTPPDHAYNKNTATAKTGVMSAFGSSNDPWNNSNSVAHYQSQLEAVGVQTDQLPEFQNNCTAIFQGYERGCAHKYAPLGEGQISGFDSNLRACRERANQFYQDCMNGKPLPQKLVF